MSSSQKNISSRSSLKNSDSFDDRFCDDLCEDILQYLPLKDKLRLECVSKQFQRTVLQKHNEIILEVNLEQSIYSRRSVFNYDPSYEPNVLRLNYWPQYPASLELDPQLETFAFITHYYKPIESLLRKCPHIQRIDLTGFHRCNKVIAQLMIEIITKYCNHLIGFNVLEFYSNGSEFQEFCRKFGPKLKSFLYVKNTLDFNLFPNIRSD